MELVILAIAGAFFLGHALKWFFDKTLVPDVLILGALGFLVGPVLQWVSLDDLGPAGHVLATTTLIVILYECGLNLKAHELRKSSGPALALSMCSFFLTGAVGFVVGLAFLQSWEIALLFGLGIGGTSSAVVMPMVSKLPVLNSTKVVLNLESAFTDILTIVFFLVFSQSIVSGSFSVQHLIIQVGPNTLIALLMGVGFGLLWAVVKKQFIRQMPAAFAGEAFALFVYGSTQLMGYNGAISVLTLGFTLANLDLGPAGLGRLIHRKPVSARGLVLLEQITLVLSTFFFIYLGLMIQISHIQFVFVGLLATIGILLVRYASCRMLFRPADGRADTTTNSRATNNNTPDNSATDNTPDDLVAESLLTRVHQRPNQVSAGHAAASMATSGVAAPTNKNRRRSLRMGRGITPRPLMDSPQGRVGGQDHSVPQFSFQDAVIITAMGPRGLACAVLALMAGQSSIQGREWLQEAMISVIPVSIVATSVLVALSSRPFFKRHLKGLYRG